MKTKPTAIVYVSNTGRTARYARMMGEKTGLPVYELAEARKALPKKAPIIYCGWLMATSVRITGRPRGGIRWQLFAGWDSALRGSFWTR